MIDGRIAVAARDERRGRTELEELRDRLDDRAREEHPGLGRVDPDVVEDGIQLARMKSGGSSCTAVTAVVL